jgi:RNA polymerase sigma-70 factor (ECF subfamily)
MAPAPPKQDESADLSADRAWLMAYREGEPRALERVFRAHAPLAYHVVRNGVRGGDQGRAYLPSPQEEDDVVQDTFIRLFAASTRSRYDGIRPFGALVRVVTRSALIDHLRKRDKATLLSQADDVEPTALEDWTPGAPLPDQAASSSDEQVKARAFLENLAPEDRDLFRLRFEKGLTQSDAATALGRTRQNVRTLEARLREKIEEFLDHLR